jgi:hypothetical protein
MLGKNWSPGANHQIAHKGTDAQRGTAAEGCVKRLQSQSSNRDAPLNQQNRNGCYENRNAYALIKDRQERTSWRGGPRPDPRRTGQLCGVAQSAAVNRRSRCGSVRGLPVPSSHFRPGAAPQVGQRTCRRRMMPRLGVLCYEERNTTIFLWPSCCSRASIARPGGGSARMKPRKDKP